MRQGSEKLRGPGGTCSLSAANPVLLPQPKPRALREHIVVPSIRRREIVLAQRPAVRHSEDTL